MLGKFKEAFKKDNKNTIPQVIVEALTNELPAGFKYQPIDEETLLLTPDNELNLKLSIPDILKYLPPEVEIKNSLEFAQYLHNSQQALEINEGSIILNGSEFNVGNIIKRPFSEVQSGGRVVMNPHPFDPPVNIELSSIEEEIKLNLQLKRVPYKSIYTQKHKVIGIKGMDIEFLFNLGGNNMSMNISYSLNRESRVHELLEKLKLIRAFQRNTIRFNGVLLGHEIPDLEGESIDIDASIRFWESVNKLENVLNVQFDPKVEVDDDDYYWIIRLYKSLIENIGTKQYMNVKDFILTTETLVDEGKLIDLKKPKTLLSFNQSVNFDLLGAKFDLYVVVAWYEYKIEKVELIEENPYKYKVYLNPDNLKGLIEYSTYFLNSEESTAFIQDANKITGGYRKAKFYNELD